MSLSFAGSASESTKKLVMRLFIAVDLPEDWKRMPAQVEKSIGWLGRGVKWVESQNMHLTLKFLGDTDERLLPTLSNTLSTVAQSAPCFDLQMQGTGVFPNRFKPRVFWAGLKSDGALLNLQRSVDEATIALGFAPDDHDFKPHLTLARIKEPIQKERITEAFLRYKVDSQIHRVSEFLLVQSHLSREGARYEVMGTFVLRSEL